MRYFVILFLYFSIFFFQNIDAQVAVSDSIIIVPFDSVVTDENLLILNTQNADIKPVDTFIRKNIDPNKVVWWGAVVPGMGQILNQKYWKLPIVYGGFLVCAYAITWNGTQYNSYKNASRDITDDNPKSESYLNLLPKGIARVEDYPGGISAFASRLKTGQDTYRRYRDLSVLISVLYYGLTVLDAYVDAQLFNFDISSDLSMTVRPAIINSAKIQTQSNAFGVQLSLNF
ncbi:MAG: DUF5683 domain-containing protein [Prevotellaceae bacterium]|jgi:hypothetical protein|nr:DUF5683 domain-containing protein [Prevotellaceae bacterium]